MKKILVINGPNLNMLGQRNENHYGTLTLEKINEMIEKKFPKIKFIFFQSNSEGKIIDEIQAINKIAGLVINAGAYTHTSIAIRDALEIIKVPKVAVHLSDFKKREAFRQTDYLEDVVLKVFMGKKEVSYFEAIEYLLEK